MSMQFLVAEQIDTTIHFKIWLDTTKIASGSEGNPTTNPESAWCKDYYWSTIDNPMTVADMENEAKLLAQADLNAIVATQNPTPAPTPLSMQRTTF